MRYTIVDGNDSDFHIFDHSLVKFVGDGKGYALTLATRDQAVEVVDVMAQRVGA